MNDFQPALVALDIDGTLVNHAGEFSPAVVDAVSRVVSSGVPVVLSTGRAWPGTDWAIRHLGLPPGLAVMSNGALVASHQPFEVLREVTFDPEKVVRRALELAPHALVAVEEVGRGYRVNRHFPEGEINGRISVEPVEELVADPVSRVIIRDPEGSASDFERLADALGMKGVEYFVGWTAWLDIVPEGVSKATGLDVACSRLGIAPSDVLAVGDGNNDVEMLAWAGRGVAMGNAPDAVRAVADAVTLDVDDDGLAVELNRWF